MVSICTQVFIWRAEVLTDGRQTMIDGGRRRMDKWLIPYGSCCTWAKKYNFHNFQNFEGQGHDIRSYPVLTKFLNYLHNKWIYPSMLHYLSIRVYKRSISRSNLRVFTFFGISPSFFEILIWNFVCRYFVSRHTDWVLKKFCSSNCFWDMGCPKIWKWGNFFKMFFSRNLTMLYDVTWWEDSKYNLRFDLQCQIGLENSLRRSNFMKF